MSNVVTETFFNSISTQFKGFGVNLSLLLNFQDKNLNILLPSLPVQYCKLTIQIPDPGATVLNMVNYSDMNSFFNTAPYNTDSFVDGNGTATTSTAESMFTFLKIKNVSLIITVLPPSSWIIPDGSNRLTGERTLKALANLNLSGLLWVRSFNITCDMVEPFQNVDNVENEYGYVTPFDYHVLASQTSLIAAERNLTVKIVGPNISSVGAFNVGGVGDGKLNSPYIQTFINGKNIIDIWSIHATENKNESTDVDIWDIRSKFSQSLTKEVAHMTAINFTNEKYATRIGTSLPTEGVLGGDNGWVKKVIENVVHVVKNGFSVVIFSDLVPNFYSVDGTSSRMKNVLGNILENMPIPGNIFTSDEMNHITDKTVKGLIVSSTGDRFYFILRRPATQDGLNGKLRLIVNNPLWSFAYHAKDIVVHTFPEKLVVTESTDVNGDLVTTTSGTVDVRSVQVKTKMILGSMQLSLENLPYNCLLFISGSVSLTPSTPVLIPTPPPAPSPGGGSSGTPVANSTIVQMPVNYGNPVSTNYIEGTVFYDSFDRRLKTYINGEWIPTTFLEYL